MNRNRRLAKDFVQRVESATAWLFLASVQLIPEDSQETEITTNNYESDQRL